MRYPGPARRKRGRALLITDNAPRHRSRKVRRHPERTPGVVLPYLPAAGPELGAVGEVRGQAEHGPVTPGFCATLDGPKAAVPGHSRTRAIKAGVYKYPMRSP